MGDIKRIFEQLVCAKHGVVQEKLPLIKVISNLLLLYMPLAPLSVIELMIVRDALCDFYYDVEVNYKFFNFFCIISITKCRVTNLQLLVEMF